MDIETKSNSIPVVKVAIEKKVEDYESLFFSIIMTMSKQLPKASQLTKTEARILTYIFVNDCQIDHFRGDARYKLMRTMDFSTHNLSVHTGSLRDKGWVEPFSYERLDSRGKMSMCDSWKVTSLLHRTLSQVDINNAQCQVELSIRFRVDE